MLRRILLVISLLITGIQGQAAPATITDITVEDTLGYACIPAEYLDEKDDSAALAFRLSGKLRMPRTCLPDPCLGALTPQELSNLTGTSPSSPRFDEEWNDYYARYADQCRAEVTPFGNGDPLLDGDPPKIAGFLPPSLGPISRLTAPHIPLFTPALNPILPDTGSCRNLGSSDRKWLLSQTRGDACLAGGGSAARSRFGTSAVPLPAPFLLMMTGFAAFGWAARRNKQKI